MTTQSTKERIDIILGLGELRAAKGDDTVLVCLGLGSCVGFCAFDPISKVGGMAHIVLPASSEGSGPGPKFADCAIPTLLDEMVQLGAAKSQIVIKIVGGAQMVNNEGKPRVLNIGDRNVEATKTLLAELGLPLKASDTGGNHGRTARLFLESGTLLVSEAGGVSNEL